MTLVKPMTQLPRSIAEPQPLPAAEPMTPAAAIAHLRQWKKEQTETEKHGMYFGLTVFLEGPVWLGFENYPRYPWEIGLRLIVDKPEHFDTIKQKIIDYAKDHFTELVVKEDAEGHAYFYEEQGYRFVHADGHVCMHNQYPQYGDYHYELITSEIPLLEPLEQPPPPQIEPLPNYSPEIANPDAFKKAQICPITQFFARIWACVAKAFAYLACCRNKQSA